MTEKFKKIDREYVLSDSTVNVYGFRLLTSGYDLEAFRKNPIGYYMHKREDGIVLKWEDLKVEGDQVLGSPVINMSNARGTQTCDEAENGFLNAASVGHIVVLDYSTDPEMMLPGQTGPTITRWYNKECSLVDIPGNGNALTRLYDAHENEIMLSDLGTPLRLQGMNSKIDWAELRSLLGLADTDGESEIMQKVYQLQAATETLSAEKNTLMQQLTELQALRCKQEVAEILERGIEDRKITVNLQQKLATDYANNPGSLRELIGAMPAYRTIAETLAAHPASGENNWTWNDYEKNDPSGKKLKALRANDPARYKALFDEKFAA